MWSLAWLLSEGHRLSNKFFKNSVFGALAGVCTALGGFLSNIVLARLLGVTGTGTVAYIVWASGVIATILGFGIPATLARILPELSATAAVRDSGGVLLALGRALILASLALLLVALLPYIGGIISWPQREAIWTFGTSAEFWPLIVTLAIFQLFGGFFTGYMRGMQRFELLALVTACSSAVQIVVIIVGSLWIGIWGAVAGYAAGLLLPTVLTLGAISRATGSVSPDLRARVWRYARTIWAVGLIDALVWARIEIFFLEASWGPKEVGLFSVSLTISALATQAPLLMTSGILPHLSERFGLSDWGAMRRAYTSMTRVMAFLIFPACLGTAAITPTLLPLLFGNDFRSAIPSAMILTSVAALGATASVASNLINATERNKAILYMGIGGAVLSVIAEVTIIPKFGVLGAAAARALVQTLMVVAGLWYVSVHLRCPPPIASLSRLFVAALCCAVAAWIIMAIAPQLWALPIAILCGAVTYFSMVWLLAGLTVEDWSRLRGFAQHILGWLPSFGIKS